MKKLLLFLISSITLSLFAACGGEKADDKAAVDEAAAKEVVEEAQEAAEDN